VIYFAAQIRKVFPSGRRSIMRWVVQRDWRDDRIAEVEAELAAKDARIAEQATRIAEQDRRIAELEKRL